MKAEVKAQLINYLLNFDYLLKNEEEIKKVLAEYKELDDSDNKDSKEKIYTIMYNYLNSCSLNSLFSFYGNIFDLNDNDFRAILFQSVNEISRKNLSFQDEEFYEILMTENILYPTTFCYEFFSFEETDFMLIKKLYKVNNDISNKYKEILEKSAEIIDYEEMIEQAKNSSEKSDYEEEKADAKRRKDKLENEMLKLDKDLSNIVLEISERRQGSSGIRRG